jgi:AcrR family transcriptional regulator
VKTVTSHKSTSVRKKQILNAARKLIIKYGGEHLTIRRIAKEVGITEGDIYRHFDSKKDIMSLLIDGIVVTWLRDIAKANTGGPSRLEILNDVMRKHLSTIEQRRGIPFQIIAETISLGDKELNRKTTETIGKYTQALEALLSEARRSGEVREDLNLEAASLLLFGMVQGLVNTWVLTNYDFDPQEKYSLLWNIYRQAVTKPQAGT